MFDELVEKLKEVLPDYGKYLVVDGKAINTHANVKKRGEKAKVLQRNSVKKKKIRAKAKTVRHLYDYEHLSPFREFQLDTKHILDQKALPEDVYTHILNKKFPK